MLNIYGYYEGLKRKSVLIYAAREAISRKHINENSVDACTNVVAKGWFSLGHKHNQKQRLKRHLSK